MTNLSPLIGFGRVLRTCPLALRMLRPSRPLLSPTWKSANAHSLASSPRPAALRLARPPPTSRTTPTPAAPADTHPVAPRAIRPTALGLSSQSLPARAANRPRRAGTVLGMAQETHVWESSSIMSSAARTSGLQTILAPASEPPSDVGLKSAPVPNTYSRPALELGRTRPHAECSCAIRAPLAFPQDYTARR